MRTDGRAPGALIAGSSRTSWGLSSRSPERARPPREEKWDLGGTGRGWGKRASGGRKMSSNGNRTQDAGPRSPQQLCPQPRRRKAAGRRWGEGGRGSRFPAAASSRRGLAPGRPSLGGMSHSHGDRGRGQANGWAGLTGGGWRADSSPAAATPASCARSRPLFAPVRRRRRARPRSPECTARRAAASVRGKREV